MFEQGAIRPPNESNSLLVRVTRNCPWNRCHICPPFKGLKFSLRSVEEVKKDIDQMAEVYPTHSGGPESAFLQDADSLVLPADKVRKVEEVMRNHVKDKGFDRWIIPGNCG